MRAKTLFTYALLIGVSTSVPLRTTIDKIAAAAISIIHAIPPPHLPPPKSLQPSSEPSNLERRQEKNKPKSAESKFKFHKSICLDEDWSSSGGVAIPTTGYPLIVIVACNYLIEGDSKTLPASYSLTGSLFRRVSDGMPIDRNNKSEENGDIDHLAFQVINAADESRNVTNEQCLEGFTDILTQCWGPWSMEGKANDGTEREFYGGSVSLEPSRDIGFDIRSGRLAVEEAVEDKEDEENEDENSKDEEE